MDLIVVCIIPMRMEIICSWRKGTTALFTGHQAVYIASDRQYSFFSYHLPLVFSLTPLVSRRLPWTHPLWGGGGCRSSPMLHSTLRQFICPSKHHNIYMFKCLHSQVILNVLFFFFPSYLHASCGLAERVLY